MRAFVFGAGASVHAGYPLASKLWPAVEQWARQSVPSGDYCDGAVDRINDLFDLALPFEQILTEIDKRIESPRDIYEKVSLPVLRGQIQQLVCQYFDSIRSHNADLYSIFAQRVLAQRDVVITFNYDVALDRELQKSGKWSALDGYGFSLDPSAQRVSSCKLFKLHGSTNWIAQIFDGLKPGGFAMGPPNASLGNRPVIPTSDLEYLGANFADPQFKGTGGFVPSLIMPAAVKKFYMKTSLNLREWEDFWNSLWSQAEESVATAEEVHVIGYSLPDHDERAGKLLRTSRQGSEFSICCQSDTARLVETFQKMGFTNTHSGGDGSFEGWLGASATQLS